MTAPRVLLRADCGPEVGVGHLMRTRAVAQALAARGAEPVFGIDDPAAAVRLAAEGFEAAGSGALHACEQEWRAAWFDGFGDWSEELRLHALRGTRTVLVENRGPARERADFSVYPALHYTPDAWDRAHPERVRGGAAWIPLAREVQEAEPEAERATDLLVTFGGADPGHLTERLLAALGRAGYGGRVEIAVGAHMDARREAIARAADVLPRATLLARPADLVGAMTHTRAAATALGTTLYELAWLGVPALILANYPEDRAALEHYTAHGPHVPLGVSAELDERELARRLAAGLASLTERLVSGVPRVLELGGGADRLAGLLLAPEGDCSQSAVQRG